MSIPPELAAGLTAYAHLWQPLATDAAVEALFAPNFVDHRPGADGAVHSHAGAVGSDWLIANLKVRERVECQCAVISELA
jgi:hypothetical protein